MSTTSPRSQPATEPVRSRPTTGPRLSGTARREQILEAATHVVAGEGFAATTEQVARAAGVSQPYVIRLFGGKRELMLAVLERAADRVLATFAEVEGGAGAADRLAAAYVGLLDDRDLLLVLMQGFVGGGDEEVGRIARRTLAGAYRRYVEATGNDGEPARIFLASGMLLTILAAVRAPEHRGEDAGVDAMVDCVFGALPSDAGRRRDR